MKKLCLLLTSLIVLACFSSRDARAAAGDLDPSFNPNANGSVYGMAVQPDGKLLVGGLFTTIGGVTRNYVARLNADGSLETGFNANVNDGSQVQSLTVQPDGKIVVCGDFTTIGGMTRNYVARLNADGSLDTGFNAKAGNVVDAVALQPDGKLVMGGFFTTMGGATRNYLARLNTDGTTSTSFNPNANNEVMTVAVQPDGKLVVGGNFTTMGGVTRNYLARLNADGSLDTNFNPNANGYVASVALQADGKIVVGGNFTTIGGVTRNYVARLNADGSLDTNFNPGSNDSVIGLAVQADGKIVITGYFTQEYGRAYLARFNADGSLDTSFYCSTNPTSVAGAVIQADGKIVIGGSFSTVSGVTRNNLARLANDPAAQKIVVTGSSTNAPTIQWLRGGALPETTQVTFEFSTDNGTSWTRPAAATRITGGWQLQNALSGHNGLARARALISSGFGNGSTSVEELVAAYPTPDISLESPVATALNSNTGAVDFGEQPLGASARTQRTFTIRNSGEGNLSLGTISVDGTNSGDFAVNANGLSASLATGGSTTFIVTFAPTGTTSGFRNATLHVASNANGTNSPYNVALTGLGLSTTASTGNDGLNDQAKYNLAALGFDWQISQPALVQTYYNGANSAGLYTTAQVQALNVGTPLIQKDASTGQFKLTIAVQQSANLQTFTPLSLTSGGSTMFNAAGALEFRFNSSTGAQFYRLQSK